MGIGNGQAKLLQIVIDLADGEKLESVCEFGAQVPLVAELSKLLACIGNKSAHNITTAKDIYLALGIRRYVAIDINGEFGALVFDVNNDIAATYGYIDTFDLVTNFGTTEHCFNQYEAFRNMHNSCKVGGYMLHTVPAQGWGQHCFYRYDSNLFRDLSDANGYEILHLAPFLRLKSFRTNHKDRLKNIESMCRFIESKMGWGNFEADDPYYDGQLIYDVLQKVGFGRSLFNVTLGCVLKKTTDADFVTPIQGMYQLG